MIGVPAEGAEVTFDRTTQITLEHPVRVPGATLLAGDYVFILSTSEVVWIRNEVDNQVYGPYFTRPVRRSTSSSRRKIVVRVSAASGIPTLRVWFGRRRFRILDDDQSVSVESGRSVGASVPGPGSGARRAWAHSLYRLMNSRRVSCVGSGLSVTEISSMVSNQRFSLTHS